MWTLLVFLVLIGVLAYFILVWSPDEDKAPSASGLSVTSAQMPESMTESQQQMQTAVLEAEEKWYGVTFRGYEDRYRVSTTCTIDEARQVVRDFFTSRKAKITLEEGYRMIFHRGSWLLKILGGRDTWMPQDISITFEIEGDLPKISIQYKLPGFHIRTPPNQLHREVLELMTKLKSSKMNSLASGSVPVVH